MDNFEYILPLSKEREQIIHKFIKLNDDNKKVVLDFMLAFQVVDEEIKNIKSDKQENTGYI